MLKQLLLYKSYFSILLSKLSPNVKIHSGLNIDLMDNKSSKCKDCSGYGPPNENPCYKVMFCVVIQQSIHNPLLKLNMEKVNHQGSFSQRNTPWISGIGLLPDTQNCGCACAGNAGNVFPVTAGKRSRHASRHVRHARAVMHAGIAN